MKHRPLAALLLLLLSTTPALASPDAQQLFRQEYGEVPKQLRLKESDLSDETRFALAASGISWRAGIVGTPLLVGEKKNARFGDPAGRAHAFRRATQAGPVKEAFAFALSLVLDRPEKDDTTWKAAYDHLDAYGPDFDRALIGVLQAPEKAPVLPHYQYAAMDALVLRAAPRLLPLFLALAESDDRYLRSRAVVGLGVIGYRRVPGAAETIEGFSVPVREYGISAVQQQMIAEAVRKASEDGNYRVRAAAALALGLIGGAEEQARLQKFAKDKAYRSLGVGGDKRAREVEFPVRWQAMKSLARFGEDKVAKWTDFGRGSYPVRDAGKLTRGGKDVTKDQDGLRKDQHVAYAAWKSIYW
jgi:HEAT repeat protein